MCGDRENLMLNVMFLLCFVRTSWQELHDEVEVDWVLEGVVHLYDPLVVSLDEDVPLCPDVRDLLLLDHVGFAQNLHRVHVAGVSLLDEPDLKKRKTITLRCSLRLTVSVLKKVSQNFFSKSGLL
jgi:hypothetical protein